jgi:hypothetical protein
VSCEVLFAWWTWVERPNNLSIYVSWTYFAFVDISKLYPRSGFCYVAHAKDFLGLSVSLPFRKFFVGHVTD